MQVYCTSLSGSCSSRFKKLFAVADDEVPEAADGGSNRGLLHEGREGAGADP